MAEFNSEISGIIPVNKPQGWTSFDVIAKLRGVLKIKRLGHAGTLDPMAVGVLPVFVGKATRACDIMPDDKKTYLAGFKLGLSTDTQDITGIVLTQNDKKVNINQLSEAAENFIGDIMQMPPMYSAVKVDGKKLYELAREGKVVERNARPVYIDKIEIISFDEESQSGEMLVSCSRGTYIRTVIHDIGQVLECGATMVSLKRTLSGGFNINECFSIEDIQQAMNDNEISKLVKPVTQVFSCYESIKLNAHHTKLYKNGVKLRLEQVGISSDLEGRIFSVFGYDNEFIGLAKVQKEFAIYKNFF